MWTQDAVDFETIVQSIRNHNPDPSVMRGPAYTELGESLIDTMTDLVHEIENRHYRAEKGAFYMHPVTANGVFDEQMENYWMPNDIGASATLHGRPIRTHATIPEGMILFLAPDAVSLGGKIHRPEIIAYAD